MRFDGGPYDGRDLPIQPPSPKWMRLPSEGDLEAFLGITKDDPGATGEHDWPYIYELDESGDSAVYRFKGE